LLFPCISCGFPKHHGCSRTSSTFSFAAFPAGSSRSPVSPVGRGLGSVSSRRGLSDCHERSSDLDTPFQCRYCRRRSALPRNRLSSPTLSGCVPQPHPRRQAYGSGKVAKYFARRPIRLTFAGLSLTRPRVCGRQEVPLLRHAPKSRRAGGRRSSVVNIRIVCGFRRIADRCSD